jgi:hypothetical protein
VYDADIRPLGLRVVELQGAVSDSAVAEVRALLDDPARRERDTDHTVDVAHRHLGYGVLRERLEGLLAELQVAARR